MEPNKTPTPGPDQNPENQEKFKSDPNRLKDMAKRFSYLHSHEKNEKAEPEKPKATSPEPPKTVPQPKPSPTIQPPRMTVQKPEAPLGPQPIGEFSESWLYRNRLKIVIIIGAVLVLFFGGRAILGLLTKGSKMSLKETMRQQQEAAKDAPVAVKGFKVGRFNYEDSLNVLGTIKGAMEVKLSFEVPGVISSINYREGERYEEGALLISLKQDDILLRLKRAQAAFNKAESQAKVTENEVAENEKLFRMGAIPASTLEKKKLELDAARYEAETQRLEMKANEAMLEKSNLYAPSSGMLGGVGVQEGENISQSTLIGTHINIEYVYAEFGIVERDVQKISVGQKAKIFVDAYPDKTFEGVIENVAPQIAGTSRTSTARVRIENPERFLLPGMFSRVRILLYGKKDALVVPTDAIQGGEGEKWMYVVKMNETGDSKPEEILPQQGGLTGLAAMALKKQQKSASSDESVPAAKRDEGLAEKRPITVGYTRTDYTQIDAGVTEGEIVVLTGFERLEDGKKIRLVETQEAEL